MVFNSILIKVLLFVFSSYLLLIGTIIDPNISKLMLFISTVIICVICIFSIVIIYVAIVDEPLKDTFRDINNSLIRKTTIQKKKKSFLRDVVWQYIKSAKKKICPIIEFDK